MEFSTACEIVSETGGPVCWASKALTTISIAPEHLNRGELVTLDEFMKKFPHLAFRCCQRFPSQRGRAIHTPQGLAVSPFGRSQVSFLFEPLEERIQASCTDSVAVPRELLNHAQTEDWPLHRMMKNVEPNEAGVQIAIRGRRIYIWLRFRHRITSDVNISAKSIVQEAIDFLLYIPAVTYVRLLARI